MYFQPRVIYRNPDAVREDSVIKYIGTRVLRENKNFLVSIVGSTGSGKSWFGLALAEKYSKMFNIPFNPMIHVISSLKELLLLITSDDLDKKIQIGSIIMFDEPQTEANSRDWQSEANRALAQLVSTFRNQRLVVLFVTPYIEFLDKQSRMLFHGEFKVLGYDKNTKITKVKPRFLEWNKKKDDFYRKRLIIEYKVKDKPVHEVKKLGFWHVPMASKETIAIYEAKKKKFTDELNLKLLKEIEMKEKQQEGKNKADDFIKLMGLYEKYGEDYIKLCQEMPHITPLSLEKMVLMIKRTLKTTRKGNSST